MFLASRCSRYFFARKLKNALEKRIINLYSVRRVRRGTENSNSKILNSEKVSKWYCHLDAVYGSKWQDLIAESQSINDTFFRWRKKEKGIIFGTVYIFNLCVCSFVSIEIGFFKSRYFNINRLLMSSVGL